MRIYNSLKCQKKALNPIHNPLTRKPPKNKNPSQIRNPKTPSRTPLNKNSPYTHYSSSKKAPNQPSTKSYFSLPIPQKKQYRKLVIVYHPDKNIGDDTAKQKFQKLKEAYDILTDPEKKKIYDETGVVGDAFDEGSFQTAYQYFRGLYKKIQKEDIEEFQKRYRNGDMEKEDLMEFY